MDLIAVLFDLDNTLYPEVQFVRGGFAAAAAVCATYGAEPERASLRMYEIAESTGRAAVFDAFASEAGLPPAAVPEMVWAYRTHTPVLALFQDAEEALSLCRQRGYRTGIVTDGSASVQWRKIHALSLADRVDVIVCTDEIGPGYHKPSHVPFEIALRTLGLPASHAAYIADDPSKDFGGPNALAMRSILIDRPVELGFSLPAGVASDEAQMRATDLVAALGLIASIEPGAGEA